MSSTTVNTIRRGSCDNIFRLMLRVANYQHKTVTVVLRTLLKPNVTYHYFFNSLLRALHLSRLPQLIKVIYTHCDRHFIVKRQCSTESK